MVAKKKLIKKSGPSTGGKTISRAKDKGLKTKVIPYTSVTPTIGKNKINQKWLDAVYPKVNKARSGPKDFYDMIHKGKIKPSQSRVKKSKPKKNFNMPVVERNYHWGKKPKGNIST